MADVEKFMSVEAGDIEKIMGVETGDIEAVMGVEYPASGLAWAGTRALVMGGHYYNTGGSSRSTDNVQYKTLTTDGNTAAFDDLSTPKQETAGSGSNVTRVINGGGRTYAASNAFALDSIDYMVVASLGSVADAGNLNEGSHQGGNGGASNGTLCFFVGGGNLDANMEQMNIGTTSGATDAGDIVTGTSVAHVTTNGDSKFLIIGIGTGTGNKTAVDEHNFSTSADSSAYGSVATIGVGSSSAVCAVNRVVVAGGYIDASNTMGTRMHYFPVASSADSDSSDAADLVVGAVNHAATSDGTRGEWYGGGAMPDDNFQQNDIQKVTIASLANAQDIGDLTTADSASGSQYEDAEANGIDKAAAQTGT